MSMWFDGLTTIGNAVRPQHLSILRPFGQLMAQDERCRRALTMNGFVNRQRSTLFMRAPLAGSNGTLLDDPSTFDGPVRPGSFVFQFQYRIVAFHISALLVIFKGYIANGALTEQAQYPVELLRAEGSAWSVQVSKAGGGQKEAGDDQKLLLV